MVALLRKMKSCYLRPRVQTDHHRFQQNVRTDVWTVFHTLRMHDVSDMSGAQV